MAGSKKLAIRKSILSQKDSFGFEILDFRFEILDFGFEILDFGFEMLDF